MPTKEAFHRILSRYLPDAFVDYISELLSTYKVTFKVVKPRKTKLGDFRVRPGDPKPQITVNGDLNPYSFLVTTIHEFAHLKTYLDHGWNVPPHGREWKNNYRELLIPVIHNEETPENLREALLHSINNMKASSCSDQKLQRVLLTFNSSYDEVVTLESLPKNSIFAINNRTFRKEHLRRTRYMCRELSSGRSYLISALAHVEPIENEQ